MSRALARCERALESANVALAARRMTYYDRIVFPVLVALVVILSTALVVILVRRIERWWHRHQAATPPPGLSAIHVRLTQIESLLGCLAAKHPNEHTATVKRHVGCLAAKQHTATVKRHVDRAKTAVLQQFRRFYACHKPVLCCICYDALDSKAAAAIVPCGHVICITCSNCIFACPMCNGPAVQRMRIYFN